MISQNHDRDCRNAPVTYRYPLYSCADLKQYREWNERKTGLLRIVLELQKQGGAVNYQMDHENLDVYQIELQFVAWTTDLMVELLNSAEAKGRRIAEVHPVRCQAPPDFAGEARIVGKFQVMGVHPVELLGIELCR